MKSPAQATRLSTAGTRVDPSSGTICLSQNRNLAPKGLQPWDALHDPMISPLSPAISSKRVPSPVPDVPAVSSPRCSSPNGADYPQDFDIILDQALKDLKMRLTNAHRREMRHSLSSHGPGMEVSHNSTRESQLAQAQMIMVPSAPRQPPLSLPVSASESSVSPTPPVGSLKTSSSVVNFADGGSVPRAQEKSRRSNSARLSRRGSVSGVVAELREAVFNKQVARMQSALADRRVMVNRHLLKQRLVLEYNLVVGSWKLLRWLICFIPLIWTLGIFEPGHDIGNVHEMLIEHYGLSHTALLSLKEWDHVYGFFKKFKEQNDLLEPTGKIFWCDPRYLDILGITTAGQTEFERQRELSGFGASGSSVSTSSAGGRRLEGDHSQYADEPKSELLSRLRRLATSSGSSSSAATSTATSTSLEAILLALKHVYQNPTPLGVDPHGHERLLFDCQIPTDKQLVDIHHKLETARLGNATVTSPRRRRTDGYGPLDDYKKYFPNEFNESYLAYINHIYENKTEPDTGTYLSRFHYPYSAVSLFHPVIYQDRFALHECNKNTFADYFNYQGFNILSPEFGQNAPKAVDILECVERSKHVHDTIAEDIDTDRFTYMGKHVYARLAGQAGDHTGPDFSDWQRIGWLGKQTETASISVLIYIDGLEMFTSLSVHFTQGAGGSIECKRAIASVVELADRGTETEFHISAFLTIVNCLVCLIYDLSNCRRLRKEHKRLDNQCLYEVFARITMFAFIILVEVMYVGRETMLSQFKDAFDTFLYRTDFSHTGQVNALQHFFEVKEHVHATDEKHMQVKIIGTVVYALQVVQLILLLGAHPRVDLLCATIVRTINGLVHYILIFIVTFALLGYYAHWMFSSTLPNIFGSFFHAVLKQTEMIVGYADAWPWEEMKLMNSAEFAIFFMYLVVYFAVVFMILLNFLIAIILEGFFGVWKSLTEENAGGSGKWLPIDLWHSWRGACVHRNKKWPSRIDVITRIESFEHTQTQWDTIENKKTDTQLVSEVMLVDEYGFEDEEAALDFLTSYALRAPLILDLKPNKDKKGDASKSQQSSSHVHTPGTFAELAEAYVDVGDRELSQQEDQQELQFALRSTVGVTTA